MSRREIDALVDEVLRAEQGVPPARVVRDTSRRPRLALRWAIALWLILGSVFVAGLVAHRSSGPLDPFEGLPSHPTTYADGQYGFIHTQPDRTGRPVGWNPCTTIPVRLNPDHASDDAESQMRTAIAVMNQVSGLHLTYDGTTLLSRTSEPRDSGEIVVSFTTDRVDSSLVGAVANSQSFSDGAPAPEMSYYTSGRVTVNWPVFDRLPGWSQQAVLLHEFGHAVGLSHVSDPHQIMSARGVGTATYQHGDLTGLARLGALPCQ